MSVLLLGPPTESFATPPWMSRRFAEKLVTCASSEEVLELVSEHIRDAVAFTSFCQAWIDREETRGWKLPDDVPHPNVTACGYFVLDVLRAIEAAYPEGLTEIPEDQS